MRRTVDEKRRKLLKRIMHEFGRNPKALPAVNDLGRQFIVTALGEEPVSALFARVRAAGGYANVFISTRGSVVLLPFIRKEGAFETGEEADLSMPVNADSTVDMFLDYCEVHPEGIVLKLAGPQHLPAVAAHPESLEAFV